jgi:hypothetical protein
MESPRPRSDTQRDQALQVPILRKKVHPERKSEKAHETARRAEARVQEKVQVPVLTLPLH